MLTYNLRNVKIMMKKYTCDKLLVMKKILLFLTVFLFTIIPSFGIEENLTFLYINGSNNNDTKMKDWYINGVNKLHPVLKEKFEENESIKKWAQENKLTIDDDPQIFFWGYDSKEDLDFVKDRLNLSDEEISGLIDILDSDASREMVLKFIEIKKGNKDDAWLLRFIVYEEGRNGEPKDDKKISLNWHFTKNSLAGKLADFVELLKKVLFRM